MSTLPPNACRLRVRYAKDGRLAYLGHLEVMETIMHSVRRSGLPFEVGNGFAKRMRIQFSQALPVGASSMGEYYDLLLSDPLDADEALDALVRATPAAIAPSAAKIMPRRIAALEAWANLSVWEVQVRRQGVDVASFEAGLERVRTEGVIHFMRGTKPRQIEIEHSLGDCKVCRADGGVDLTIITRVTERGSLRPAILVNEVCGCMPLRTCRVGQWHENEDGTLVDPMAQA